MDRVRYCPRCRCDFLPVVAVCVDCGGELEDRFEESDPALRHMEGRGASSAATVLAPEEGRAVYFSYDPESLRPLMQALDRRGIPYRVDAGSPAAGRTRRSGRMELVVRDADRAVVGEEIARLPGAGREDPPGDAIDRDFDPGSGYRRCPACSATLGGNSPECPDCGLTLAQEGAQAECASCAALLDPDSEACPACGAASGRPDRD